MPPSTPHTTSSGSVASSLYLIYFLVVLYALCYQLQAPIEPFLVEKILKNNAASETSSSASLSATYAKLKSFFSVVQSVGSLAFGVILDRYGVRVGLVINFAACATCYYILSITDSVTLLYISRVPGIAMVGFLCAQTAVMKLTNEGEERLKALGRLTTSYTIGGTLGPYVGGHLGASGDYYVGARYATIGSVISMFLVFLLPSNIDKHISNADDDKDSQGKVNKCKEREEKRWRDRISLLLNTVGVFLAIKMVTSISNSMARSSQPLILKKLGANEAMMGNIMSIQFAFGGFANGFLLAPVTSLMGGRVSSVIKNCFTSMGLIYLFQAILFYPGHNTFLDILHVKSVFGDQNCFVALALILSLLQYSLGTSITAETSAIVAKCMQGTLMGCEHCIFAAASMVGPTLGVMFLEAGGLSCLSMACACLFGISTAVWYFSGR